MESRIDEFLKSCNKSQSSPDFMVQYQNLAKKITQSKDFIQELKRHSALANKYRLLIYHLLKDGEQCNCSLARILGLSEGSITHHIKKLEDAGLIVGRNRGHFTIYYTAANLKKSL
ncbi:MAG: winged helix-turn-helix domain-containing protein [Candidatus Lokiarchaeota archaeon]|nr:winged helix-turn-helix domain-containing protein [Candidatus Harpocratesius repetitus]